LADRDSEAGRPRLENPEDFVRVEVGSALKFGKRVISVLVHKTEMPRADALPEPLKPLARRNAVGFTQERFKADAQGLVKALEDALAEVEEARRRTAAEASTAAEKRALEQAAKAEEAARAEKERARLDAIAGLSPEQIAKAEELANWDFIKSSESIEDFRDHLARFPRGVSERWARSRLEARVWTELSRSANGDALRGFLEEFPKGAHAIEAAAKLAGLEAAEHGKFEIEEDLRARSPSRLRLLTPPGLRSAAILRRRIEAGLIRTFAGHTAQVLAVAFSPDGRSALSGSGDRTLKLWDVATGKEIRTLAAHSEYVSSVAFSPDGRSALSGGGDDTLKLWDVATGRELSTLAGHTAAVTSVAFSPDGGSVLSGSADESLKLWDVATGKEIRTFTGHTERVMSVAISPDGRSVLSGSDDMRLKLWDVATGKEIHSFTGHADSVGSVVFSPDGRSALSGSHDMSLKLWNLPVRG
jgi:dipeptidyl aminopeptidase/acylaminoacyl peptidase